LNTCFIPEVSVTSENRDWQMPEGIVIPISMAIIIKRYVIY